MPLLLTRDELRPLLDLEKAIDLIEDAHRQQASGQIVPHAPYHIQIGGRTGLRVVSGAMLGSRRAGVTLAAGSLQRAGIISYSRGKVIILDRQKLERVSCECHRIVKDEYERLLGNGIPVRNQ